MEGGTASLRPVSSSLKSAGSAPKLSSPSHVRSSSFSSPGEDSCSAASATCAPSAGAGLSSWAQECAQESLLGVQGAAFIMPE